MEGRKVRTHADRRSYRTPTTLMVDGFSDAAAAPFPELQYYRTAAWRRFMATIAGTPEGFAWAAQCEHDAHDARELARRFEENSRRYEEMHGEPYPYALERARDCYRRAEASEIEAAALRTSHE
jgi:hypothetical protein